MVSLPLDNYFAYYPSNVLRGRLPGVAIRYFLLICTCLSFLCVWVMIEIGVSFIVVHHSTIYYAHYLWLPYDFCDFALPNIIFGLFFGSILFRAQMTRLLWQILIAVCIVFQFCLIQLGSMYYRQNNPDTTLTIEIMPQPLCLHYFNCVYFRLYLFIIRDCLPNAIIFTFVIALLLKRLFADTCWHICDRCCDSSWLNIICSLPYKMVLCCANICQTTMRCCWLYCGCAVCSKSCTDCLYCDKHNADNTSHLGISSNHADQTMSLKARERSVSTRRMPSVSRYVESMSPRERGNINASPLLHEQLLNPSVGVDELILPHASLAETSTTHQSSHLTYHKSSLVRPLFVEPIGWILILCVNLFISSYATGGWIAMKKSKIESHYLAYAVSFIVASRLWKSWFKFVAQHIDLARMSIEVKSNYEYQLSIELAVEAYMSTLYYCIYRGFTVQFYQPSLSDLYIVLAIHILLDFVFCALRLTQTYFNIRCYILRQMNSIVFRSNDIFHRPSVVVAPPSKNAEDYTLTSSLQSYDTAGFPSNNGKDGMNGTCREILKEIYKIILKDDCTLEQWRNRVSLDIGLRFLIMFCTGVMCYMDMCGLKFIGWNSYTNDSGERNTGIENKSFNVSSEYFIILFVVDNLFFTVVYFWFQYVGPIHQRFNIFGPFMQLYYHSCDTNIYIVLIIASICMVFSLN